MSIPIEQPPIDTTPEMQDYLVRQLQNIDAAIDGVYRLPTTNTLPAKPRDGDVRYFGRALPPTITAPGFWGYENGVWVPLSLVEHLGAYDPHPQYVLEGYGGLIKTTDTNYGSLGDGAWTVIDNWDEGMLFSPRYVVQDIAGSGLRFEEQGIYGFAGTFAISFDDVNRGRTFGVRLWNATKSVPGRPVEYFVGRNQEGVNISQGALLAEIGAAEVGDLFQIQIAAIGDTFNPVTVVDALYSARRVGL